jgi:hypothetical protein
MAYVASLRSKSEIRKPRKNERPAIQIYAAASERTGAISRRAIGRTGK